MMFNCNALYSIDKSLKGFVIPAFSIAGSNEIFFQDLYVDGRVREFVRVDTSNLFHVPIIPPLLSVSVGEFGLLAFIHDDNCLKIGTPLQLSKSIKVNLVSDPVTRMEIASLLGDKSMQKRALRECRNKFLDQRRFENWVRRETRLFRRVIVDFSKSASGSNDGLQPFDKEFREIEADLQDRNWMPKWLKLWENGYDKRRLVGVAYLRQDHEISFEGDGPEIFRRIAESDFRDGSYERCIKILSSTSLLSNGWYSLYVKLHYIRSDLQDRLKSIGFEALKQHLNACSKSDYYQWILLWHFEYRTSGFRSELANIGISFVKNCGRINVNVVQNIIFPLSRSEREFEFVRPEAVEWLISSFRSDTLWATLFIRAKTNGVDDVLHDCGLKWLYELGGNLNQWKQIWHLYRGYISEEQYIYIGLNWLRRARKDMKIWFEVFLELFENDGLKTSGELLQIGVDWLRSSHGNTVFRREISHIVDYMQSLR